MFRTLFRQVSIRCPSKSVLLVCFGLPGLLLWLHLPLYAQSVEKPIAVGYVSLTTAQQSESDGRPYRFAPYLLVRFSRTDSSDRVLAMTDQSGTTIVALDPGMYCLSAYGLDGKPVALATRSQRAANRCLTVKAGRTIGFSVTIAAGAKYLQSIPSLGVE